MKIRSLFIFVGSIFLISSFFIYLKTIWEVSSPPEWNKQTRELKEALNKLPTGWFGEIYMRYDGSNFVKLVDSKDNFSLDVGMTSSTDFSDSQCIEILKISGYKLVCLDSFNLKEISNRACAHEYMGEKGRNLTSIMNNADGLKQAIRNLKFQEEIELQIHKDDEVICSLLK